MCISAPATVEVKSCTVSHFLTIPKADIGGNDGSPEQVLAKQLRFVPG